MAQAVHPATPGAYQGGRGDRAKQGDDDRMSDKASEERALRTMKVTGRVALTHSDDPPIKSGCASAPDVLLAKLEGAVMAMAQTPGSWRASKDQDANCGRRLSSVLTHRSVEG
jgi:hypothetical protein